MARAKYQVLVIPFIRQNDKVIYPVFKRKDMGIWQFIAGGGEDEDASHLETAKREAFEEANISKNEKYYVLDTLCSISTEGFKKHRLIWGEKCLVIPEYSFAVELTDKNIRISNEHTEYEWVEYQEAVSRLRYDSNRVALWELNSKISLGMI